MEPCPFCNTAVNADLIRFGGTCPSCFGEIPGEEAATDPGEAVKAAQAKEDEQRAQRRMLVPMLGLVAVGFALSGVACFLGYQAMNTQTELAVEIADINDEVVADPDAPKTGEGRLVVDPVVIDEATGTTGYRNPRTGEVIQPDADGNVVIVDEQAGVKRVINAATGETEVFDIATGEKAMVDTETGMAVLTDPETGEARIVDARTGITSVVEKGSTQVSAVIDPVTGERREVDPKTGLMVIEDEVTGVTSVVNTKTGVVSDVDTRTGVATVVDTEDGTTMLYDPETGETAEVDTRTGTATFVNEESGTTRVVDPTSGVAAEVDAETGSATLVNPRTGQATIINPEEGTVAKIDPLTGTAIAVAPKVEASEEELEGIAATPDGRLPSDEELAALDEDLLPSSRIRTRSEISENFQVGNLGTATEGSGTTSGSRVVDSRPQVGSGSTRGPREASVKVDASTDVTTTKASQYTVLGLTPDVSISRREQLGIRLEDDQAIIEMIRRVMETEIPRLRVCYERRLKTEPDLKGRWRIGFTVQADGYTRDVTATGTDTRDAQLESCIVEKVKNWQFQRIREDQPISKSVSFRPS
ncbi:MAG: hypothetical protein EP330_29675 [Deltaproteobacteria bacterium]|nr:MAG: hypothetical protein EP330_29675 [Deltaproteobacteria bacterium]